MPVDEAILGVSQSRGSPQTIAASVSTFNFIFLFIMFLFDKFLFEKQDDFFYFVVKSEKEALENI